MKNNAGKTREPSVPLLLPIKHDTFWCNWKFPSHSRRALVLQVRNHNQCLFDFLLLFLNVQISSGYLHLDFLTEQKPLSHSSAEHQAQHLCPRSLPECVCVVWLVRPLWFRSDPRSMSCGGGVSEAARQFFEGDVPAWGNKILSAKLSMFSKNTEPERHSHAKPRLATVRPVTFHGYFWPSTKMAWQFTGVASLLHGLQRCAQGCTNIPYQHESTR